MGEHRHRRFFVGMLSFFAMALLPGALAASPVLPPSPESSFEAGVFQDEGFQESFLISRADAILEQRLERLEQEWAKADKSLPTRMGTRPQSPSFAAGDALISAGPPAFGALRTDSAQPLDTPHISARAQAPVAGHYSLKNYLEGHERTGPPSGTHP